jgi:hypothetical protein
MRLGQVFVTAHLTQAAFGTPELKFVALPLVEEFRLVFGAEDGVDAVIVEFVDEVDEAMGGVVQVFREHGHAGDEHGVEAACDLHIVLAGAGAEAEGVEIKPHGVVGAIARGDLAVLDGDRQVGQAGVGGEALEVVEHEQVAFLICGRKIGVRLFQVTEAVVRVPCEVEDGQGLVNELDGGQEALALKAVLVQLRRWLVGGEHQRHLVFEQGAQQAMQDHGVADVFHIKLVQTQDTGLAGEFLGHAFQGIALVVQAGQLGMDVLHKVMEMKAAFLPAGELLEKDIHEPGLAAAHSTPEIQACRRRLGLAYQL